MSPVADLSPVAATGQSIGATYSAMLSNPNSAETAFFVLLGELFAAVGTGGTYDYQRQGNLISGFTQRPQFRDVSNFNVGTVTQQAGLTLDETQTAAGIFAFLFSSNYSPKSSYGLTPRTAAFIQSGYTCGASGALSK